MSGKSKAKGKSNVEFKSVAQFFAENKAIAGFQNPGKNLYMTVRELIENALDAAEAVPTNPDVQVVLEELESLDVNALRDYVHRDPQKIAEVLLETGSAAEKIAVAAPKLINVEEKEKEKEKAFDAHETENNEIDDLGDVDGDGDVEMAVEEDYVPPNDAAPSIKSTPLKGKGKGKGKGKWRDKDKDTGSGKEKERYWKITCVDNGVGMPHDEISHMLARVLAGTKYGIRQTRGKFGLGVKMVLVWALESSNIPVAVRSSQGNGSVSTCLLDIDLKRNQPKVLLEQDEEVDVSHADGDGNRGIRGTTISVIVKGTLSHYYRRHLLQYFRRLAVVTPYANIELSLRCTSATGSGRYRFEKREEARVPPQPRSVLPHASCVNHHVLGDALAAVPKTKAKSLASALRASFQGISVDLAKELVESLEKELKYSLDFKETGRQATELYEMEIVKLTNIMKRNIHRYTAPDASCLSPVGEYNFRLGVMKEYKPRLVATVTVPAAVCGGHAFVVEAAVAIGGPRTGIHIIRFANRIPLLFEEGNDVVTRVANSDINWASYKIKPKDQGVLVFASLVSTKIPFTETGKEYISYDTVEIRDRVRTAIQACCKQIRLKLSTEQSAKSQQKRQKGLLKYVPDVSRAVIGMLGAIGERHRGAGAGAGGVSVSEADQQFLETVIPSAIAQRQGEKGKEKHTDTQNTNSVVWNAEEFPTVLEQWKNGELSEDLLSKRLGDFIQTIDVDDALAYTGAKHFKDCDRKSVFWAPLKWKVVKGEGDGEGESSTSKRRKVLSLDAPMYHPHCTFQLFKK